MAVTTRILIVDDEATLLRMIATYLGRLGFEVQACENAAATREAFRGAAERFRVLIADLTLPDCSGDELAVELAREDTEIRVLLCSGFPVALESIPDDVRSRFAVLQKPFAPNQLAEAVRTLAGG